MEIKDLTAILVVAMVGCILVAGFIPVMENTTDPDTTFKNNGFFYATYLDENSTDTLSWDHTDPHTLTVNGVDIDTTDMDSSYTSISLGFSDKWFIRFVLDTTVIYLYDVDTAGSGSTDYASPANEKDFLLECNAGVATFTIGETTYTETISGDGLIISEKPAEYVMKKSTTSAYVSGDSFVYGVGRTDRALGVSGTSYNVVFKANVDDGVTPIAYSPNTYTVTGSSVTYSAGSSDYLDLYVLSNCKLNLTDGVNSGTVTYNQIFVPSEVTAEKAIHADANTATIISMIPIILILGIVLMFVGVVIVRRYV